MPSPLVTINLVVYNGEKYLRYCLDAVKAQSYSNIEVNIVNNNSSDSTAEIISKEYPEFKLIKNSWNLGMWWGQEKALEYSHGDYIVALSVDIMLDSEFITRSVSACEADPKIGAIQAKIFQYSYAQLADKSYNQNQTLDTCGFYITRSRKVGNLGHGQKNSDQFNTTKEIFGVEGAVPFIRRKALEDSRISGHIVDPDYRVGPYGYGDDLDLVWRMHLYNWKQIFVPSVIAYHDRSTTKGSSQFPILGQLKRLGERGNIAIEKRRLDWSNVRFTIIKNDDIINLLKDLPYILGRELMVFGYTFLFEPKVFAELPRFLRLIPTMLARRKVIQQKRVLSSADMRQWFI